MSSNSFTGIYSILIYSGLWSIIQCFWVGSESLNLTLLEAEHFPFLTGCYYLPHQQLLFLSLLLSFVGQMRHSLSSWATFFPLGKPRLLRTPPGLLNCMIVRCGPQDAGCAHGGTLGYPLHQAVPPGVAMRSICKGVLGMSSG